MNIKSFKSFINERKRTKLKKKNKKDIRISKKSNEYDNNFKNLNHINRMISDILDMGIYSKEFEKDEDM